MNAKTIAIIHELLQERTDIAKQRYTDAETRRSEVYELSNERLMKSATVAAEKAKTEYDKYRCALYEFGSAAFTLH